MTRALIYIGLALALVLAPTLCCCKAGWLTPTAGSALTRVIAQPTSGPAESCCHRVKKACCDTGTHDHTSTSPEKPGPAHAPVCACCQERPEAAPPEGAVTESNPQPTGELLALALSDLLGAPVHAVSPRFTIALGAGVDARYSALFERHVLRC